MSSLSVNLVQQKRKASKIVSLSAKKDLGNVSNLVMDVLDLVPIFNLSAKFDPLNCFTYESVFDLNYNKYNYKLDYYAPRHFST